MTVKLKKKRCINRFCLKCCLIYIYVDMYLRQQVIKILVKSGLESVQDLDFRLGIQTKVLFTNYSVLWRDFAYLEFFFLSHVDESFLRTKHVFVDISLFWSQKVHIFGPSTPLFVNIICNRPLRSNFHTRLISSKSFHNMPLKSLYLRRLWNCDLSILTDKYTFFNDLYIQLHWTTVS